MALFARLLVFLLFIPSRYAEEKPNFILKRVLERPVIDASMGKALGIMHGFEGGHYMRTDDDGTYHLFPSECMADRKGIPWDVHMKSHHWVSRDGINNWTAKALIYESTGNFNGTDRRSAIWAPMLFWNAEDDRWNLFYVGYTCGTPGHRQQIDGAVYRIPSVATGRHGIEGPYPSDKATIVLDMEGAGGKPERWEGGRPDGQGDDSFFAYQLDNGTWMGFYGSNCRNQTACKDNSGARPYKVGLVSAQHLAGPYTRLGWLSPADYIEYPEGIENPIVTRTTDKSRYVAVYDALQRDQIPDWHGDFVGITQSKDGVHWGPAQYVSLHASGSGCAGVRTPQGLVPEPLLCKGCYSMLYTGGSLSADHYEAVCWVLLQNMDEADSIVHV